MKNTIQSYLADRLVLRSAELIKAIEALPEDRQNWKASDESRTGTDMLAECVLNNGVAEQVVSTHAWPADYSMDSYNQETKSLVTLPLGELTSKLHAATSALAHTIENTPDAALDVVVTTPFGELTVTDIMTYAFWNMGYHEGQINYIATLSKVG